MLRFYRPGAPALESLGFGSQDLFREQGRITASHHPRYWALILTGTYTGLRFGELAALRTNDLDTLRRTLRVDEQLSRQGSWRMVAGPLKSEKAYRTIGNPGGGRLRPGCA